MTYGEDVPPAMLEYRCFFGMMLDPNKLFEFMSDCCREDSYYMELFRQNYVLEHAEKYEFTLCPFFVRLNEHDLASPFMLTDYDLTHTLLACTISRTQTC